MQQLNIDAVFGIARSLLEKAEAARRDVGDTEDRSAADIARDAIVWSNEAEKVMQQDSHLFAPSAAGTSLIEVWADANDELNNIGDWFSFELGFDLAVQLTARIMLDPLESHDISDLLDEAQAKYLKQLRYQREKYVKHRWARRVEHQRMKEARRSEWVVGNG